MDVTERLIAFPVPLNPVPGAWTFFADTTVGAVPLGPLNPTAFSCNWVLNGYGTGQVTLPFDTSASAIGPDRVLRLWAWRLWAWYNGVPVWCGCPTGVTDNGAVGATYTLTELPGYLTRRAYDVPGGHTYTQVEQTVIAADLAGPVGDVGVALVTQPGAGFLRDRTYTYLQQDRATLLSELAGVISGPEFRSEYALSGGSPACTMRVAYPRVGSAAPGLGITIPGAGLDYQAQWDADAMRTRTFAVGDLPDNAPTTATRPVMVKDAPQPDLPRLDATDDWTGVIITSTLTEKANASAQKYAQPVLNLTATAVVDAPALGSYGVGDDVTVNITSPLLPAGYTVTGRLTQVDADAVAGTAKWTVAVTVPTPRARRTITGALAQLGAQQQAIFRKSLTTTPTTLP
jgi:hypothetical protein